VAYRVGPVTELAARAWLRTPRIALPNILLGREAFPELLQRDACAPTLAAAVLRALDERPRLLSECDEVERSLGTTSTPSREVAAMLAPWLRPSSTP
jgi:lipid-A-disaccharide synthase